MRSALFAAVATLALAAAALAQPREPEGAEGGRIIYRKVCASCHGPSARGDGPVAASMKTRPADLTGIAERRDGVFPRNEVASLIDGRQTVTAHGPREMPVWGESLANAVADEKVREERIARAIRDLVAYLESIQE
jgi:mono/diheme cytochrome c family protein